LYNENVQTNYLLYSTTCKQWVNTDIVFISWLVAEVYWFEHGEGSFKDTNFDEIWVKYVL
jgi:hypothetical protein